ncbi:MAG: hypothetical protein A2063_09305 [Gallionellales bacterium GWA2_60_142]|jgi:type IV pilus assembly protein PilE|nr:MAG: hypothetical protein A2063_09305 [Gallionellales bacterium GWA2_60_142]HCI13478.1 hypothetical protein [Gallionellaceae bacterium]
MKILTNKGFTMIELMIVVAIVGIISSIAVPAYSSYIARGKIVDAHSALTTMRMQLEQYYLDNRTYLDSGAKVSPCTAPASTDYFSYACNPLTASAYKITASNLANQGLGAAGDYVFTIDQQNAKTTTKFAGVADASAFWRTK